MYTVDIDTVVATADSDAGADVAVAAADSDAGAAEVLMWHLQPESSTVRMVPALG